VISPERVNASYRDDAAVFDRDKQRVVRPNPSHKCFGRLATIVPELLDHFHGWLRMVPLSTATWFGWRLERLPEPRFEFS
jgi:hypothetical protein